MPDDDRGSWSPPSDGPSPEWVARLAALRAAWVAELRSVWTPEQGEPYQQLDDALIAWEERFGGRLVWDYDMLQNFAEFLEELAEHWSRERPELASAASTFAAAAWEVL